MRVTTEIVYDETENEEGRLQPSVTAICSRCQHETSSFGQSSHSVRRCLVMLREECPRKEQNFYEG